MPLYGIKKKKKNKKQNCFELQDGFSFLICLFFFFLCRQFLLDRNHKFISNKQHGICQFWSLQKSVTEKECAKLKIVLCRGRCFLLLNFFKMFHHLFNNYTQQVFKKKCYDKTFSTEPGPFTDELAHYSVRKWSLHSSKSTFQKHQN